MPSQIGSLFCTNSISLFPPPLSPPSPLLFSLLSHRPQHSLALPVQRVHTKACLVQATSSTLSMYSSAGPSTSPTPSSSQADPIDLTASDDEDPYSNERMCKRACPSSRNFNANAGSFSPYPPRAPPPHSGLSPIMSSSSLQPENRLPPILNPLHQVAPMSNLQAGAQPCFTGPSSSAAFFPPQSHLFPHSSRTPTPLLSHQVHAPVASYASPSSQMSMSSPRPLSNASDRQVIDLTSSPSPPPRPPQPAFGTLPPELPPKAPVCIGLLTVTALVLYPVSYLQQQLHTNPELDWAPIRLSYEHNAAKPGGQETIHIRTPSKTSPTGEVTGGENFAVVEQKVSTFLGPMLGKGLIRLDGKVRRGMPNVSS